jgi:Pyruvate/2-oxoacid:ferredoxin oxidoreductase delta subunit/biotin operon repressor
VGAGESKFIHLIFDELINENEAKLLLAASPPATLEELAEKTGMGEEQIKEMIEPLFRKGLLFKSKKETGTRYYRVRNLLQMHDATAVAPDASKRMLDLWKQFTSEEFDGFMRKVEEVLPSPAIRVIPINVTLEARSKILAFDDIRNIVNEARSLAVVPCSCRVIDGKCGKPLEVCVQINKAADYSIERGTGRKIDKKEALEIMKQCEEEGLVHVSDNRRSPDRIICNCCSDCCINWPSIRTGLKRFVVPSRFQAVVDTGLCSACEACLERCYFGAISMEGEGRTSLVDPGRCMGCGLCLVTCPDDAISLKEVRPVDFIPE